MPPAERWKSLAAQGYIVAAADVRGRGDSGGHFIPFVNEGADGAVTIEWLRRLDECTGRVGMFGTGYGAFCAWAAAVAGNNIDAIASISPFGAIGEGLLHQGGVVRLDWLFWMHLIGGRTVQACNVPHWRTIFQHAPLNAQQDVLGRQDIWWHHWLSHMNPRDAFWAPLDLADRIASLKIPGLHVSGWWDGYVSAARYYFEAALQGGAPQRLILGPWDTEATRRPMRQVGGFDFGPRSVLDTDELLIEFFETYLKCTSGSSGQSAKEICESSVARVFITGRNEWAEHHEWPSEVGEPLILYLCSTTGANTRAGDGRLAHKPSDMSGYDAVVHNPMVPVEFQPKFRSFGRLGEPTGFTLDQSHVTGRDEALVYTSDPLDKRVSVRGLAKVRFTVFTALADSDIFVLLSDSFPSGTRDLHLGHGAIRLATLPAFDPGNPLQLEFELSTVVHDFLPGHCIRITVVPSLFPLYARNLQTRDYVAGAEPATGRIELRFGPEAAAILVLPIALDVASAKDSS